MSDHLGIIVEAELIDDAAHTLDLIRERLIRRHGPGFSALQRRLDDLEDCDLKPISIDLEPLRCILLPPVEIAALIRTARELGVI